MTGQPFAIAREGRVHLRHWGGGHYPAGLGELAEWKSYLARLPTSNNDGAVIQEQIEAAENEAAQWRTQYENV